jgi:hypothetical protein
LKKLSVVLVTQDVGNGNAHKRIGEALEKTGHHATLFLGEGKPMPEGTFSKICTALSGADWLIVSYSSARERIEEERYAMIMAYAFGVPIMMMGENYGTSFRGSWYGEVCRETALLSVVSEGEVVSAQTHVGEGTKVIQVPNPNWCTYFTATYTSDEVGQKLGIAEESKMILGIGSKEEDRNLLLYGGIIEACNRMPKMNSEIILTLHPGAVRGTSIYDDLLKESVHHVRFVGKEAGISSQEMLPRCDLVVVPGGSTVGVMACCQRRPVIDFINPVDRAWWLDISGHDYWAPARMGASLLAENVDDLQGGMEALLDQYSNVFEEQRTKQGMFFNLSDFEGAATQIITALELYYLD